MKKAPSLSLFFPAYNEEANIVDSINQADAVLKPLTNDYEIIVVDDGSRDATRALAEKAAKNNRHVRVVTHEQNKGYGSAVISGLTAAKYDYIFFTDADLQFDLSEIKKLLKYVPEYEIVLGYRAKRQDPFFRLVNAFGWKAINRLAFGLKVRDIDCAFKLLKRERVQALQLTSRGAMVSSELLTKLQRQNIPFKEVPVTHLPRKAGSPTGAKPSVILRALRELFLLYRGELGSVTHRQIVKFAMVGITNTLIDLGAYFLLTRFVPYFGDHIIVAKVLTFIVASVFSFLANRRWTFRRDGAPSFSEVIRFYLTVGIAVAINAISLHLLLPVFKNDLTPAVYATVITFIWNFTVSKLWVFKKTQGEIKSKK